MAQWRKGKIQRENGELVDAQFPVIVSASRSTDIPAFFADWFFHRLKLGYSAWTNPFNGVKSYVAYNDTRFIVFWSKNPNPLLQHLDYLKELGIGCYIQYTLNDYVAEGLERGVPPLAERIETFKTLVGQLGKGHIVWRFDPLILTDQITISDLLGKIENIGNQLVGYTEKLVFSFADIAAYKKVKTNLDKNGIKYSEWTPEQMAEFAHRLVELNNANNWNYKLATCGETANLDGIEHNHCVDDNLMIRFAHHDKALMDFLGVEIHNVENTLFGTTAVPANAIMLNGSQYAIKHKDNHDKGQRIACGCTASKDIGEYNTCPHLCEYCYANASKDTAVRNWKQHQRNCFGETITGY
jgi:DNA repair photolyase